LKIRENMGAQGQVFGAHRWSWEHVNRPINEGGKTRRRLKRDAQRSWSEEEYQLCCEIRRYFADTRYHSWQSIFKDLLARKGEHPWGVLLKGNTRESFRKLRNRLGFTESKPRNYRR